MMAVTWPVLSILMKAPGANSAADAAAAAARSARSMGALIEISRPPPAATPARRKERLDSWVSMADTLEEKCFMYIFSLPALRCRRASRRT
jgi:hypothetical protein